MAKHKLLGIGLIFLLLVAATAGCGLLEEPEEASEPISAVPIEADGPTELGDEATAGESETESSPSDDETSGAGTSTTVVIAQDESEARFSINEILRGNPTTAVGVTDQVAAEFAINFDDPGATQVGVVQVNARTIATDQNQRNRAIRQFILRTDEFEFITFTPTAVSGLPDSVTFGESYTFQITGDLTIRDITQAATFEVTMTPVSETRLEGSASSTVSRGDYGLKIPSVPIVAEVEDEVLLEIDFVATPK